LLPLLVFPESTYVWMEGRGGKSFPSKFVSFESSVLGVCISD
jgi:hypothetical protein